PASAGASAVNLPSSSVFTVVLPLPGTACAEPALASADFQVSSTSTFGAACPVICPPSTTVWSPTFGASGFSSPSASESASSSLPSAAEEASASSPSAPASASASLASASASVLASSSFASASASAFASSPSAPASSEASTVTVKAAASEDSPSTVATAFASYSPSAVGPSRVKLPLSSAFAVASPSSAPVQVTLMSAPAAALPVIAPSGSIVWSSTFGAAGASGSSLGSSRLKSAPDCSSESSRSATQPS